MGKHPEFLQLSPWFAKVIGISTRTSCVHQVLQLTGIYRNERIDRRPCSSTWQRSLGWYLSPQSGPYWPIPTTHCQTASIRSLRAITILMDIGEVPRAHHWIHRVQYSLEEEYCWFHSGLLWSAQIGNAYCWISVEIDQCSAIGYWHIEKSAGRTLHDVGTPKSWALATAKIPRIERPLVKYMFCSSKGIRLWEHAAEEHTLYIWDLL